MSELTTAEAYMCHRITELEEENATLKEVCDQLKADYWLRTYAVDALFDECFKGTGSVCDVRDYSNNGLIGYREFTERNVNAAKLPPACSMKDFRHLCADRLWSAYLKAKEQA